MNDQDPFAKYHSGRFPARVARIALVALVSIGMVGGLGYLAVRAVSSPQPVDQLAESEAPAAESADPAQLAPTLASPPTAQPSEPLAVQQNADPEQPNASAAQEPDIAVSTPASPNWTLVVANSLATIDLTDGSCVTEDYDRDSGMVVVAPVSCERAHSGIVTASAPLQVPAPTDDEAMAFIGPLCFSQSMSYASIDQGDSYYRYNEWHRFDNPKPMTQWSGNDSSGTMYRGLRTTSGYLCLVSNTTT